tara:strand:- start:2500 stop:3177 length:678 start_codon:yes stop_codon:yes gene_type:complete
MDDPIDDLTFSKRLRKPKGDITLFDKTAQFIVIPPPPPNSSLTTGKEMLTVQGATYLSTDAIQRSIKKHDKDPTHSIKIYMDLFGLKYDQQYISKLTDEAAIIIREQKNKFNRPRPYQLAPYFGVELTVLNSRTNKTPSYPSGHATQARLVAEVYAEKYPHHRENLIRAAEECGFGRVIAGFHFPSDHTTGIKLAKRLFRRLKGNKRSTSSKYSKVFGLKQKNRR